MPKGVANKKYTPGFKKSVVEMMEKEKFSYRKTAERFGVRHKRVRDWERICLTEGPEGFAIERRGHGGSDYPARAVSRRIKAKPQSLRGCGWRTNCCGIFWSLPEGRCGRE